MSYDNWKAREPESCDPGRLRSDEDRDAVDAAAMCDFCGGDAFYPMTLAGVGIACSRACLDKLERQYSAALMRRGRRG